MPATLGTCFNPRAPRGARLGCAACCGATARFQSTRPARGATCRKATSNSATCCFNPRAPRGARRLTWTRCQRRSRFNPRAPRGARHVSKTPHFATSPFQSTRPARGATDYDKSTVWPVAFQSTRPARGATVWHRRGTAHPDVSIHAPRAGRDTPKMRPSKDFAKFQSTRPARGATFT